MTDRYCIRAFEALTAETWVGRSEKELAWRLRQLLPLEARTAGLPVDKKAPDPRPLDVCIADLHERLRLRRASAFGAKS